MYRVEQLYRHVSGELKYIEIQKATFEKVRFANCLVALYFLTDANLLKQACYW